LEETSDRLRYSLLVVFMHSASVTGSYVNRNPLNIEHLVLAPNLSDKGLVKQKSGHNVWRTTEHHSDFENCFSSIKNYIEIIMPGYIQLPLPLIHLAN